MMANTHVGNVQEVMECTEVRRTLSDWHEARRDNSTHLRSRSPSPSSVSDLGAVARIGRWKEVVPDLLERCFGFLR